MQNLSAQLNVLAARSKAIEKIYRPVFYRPGKPGDQKALSAVLKLPGVTVTDTLLSQLAEFIKISNPHKRFTAVELKKAVESHIGKKKPLEYGVWVYYPWSQRLVHILDREEFIRVRTSRNQYKITPEEQALLATKKVGVVGLSVGQSVSVTMVMERICGEIRLADFDSLELTNLNRIRIGVHNLGLPKVYSVAREIAEIDPFVKVRCFDKGITEKNMDDFFLKGGKLDLMVEESDGFDFKILSRYKARELKVPVIMEASDRCMVDVERFDLEPGRSILHGIVDHLDIATLKSLKTTEEKIPYMFAVLGIESTSPRLKASMLEINQSINTWPQLASAVTMGGGITADVSRRILLNAFKGSGRYYVDIDELIGDKEKTAGFNLKKVRENPAMLNRDSMLELAGRVEAGAGFDPGAKALEKIALAGAMAPSYANAQPWKWLGRDGRLFLFHEQGGAPSFFDPGYYNSQLALGAALENAVLKAAELGYTASPGLFPLKKETRLAVVIEFAKAATILPADKALAKQIGLRHTNCNPGTGQAIDSGLLAELKAVVGKGDVRLSLITGAENIGAVARLNGQCERMRLLHPLAHQAYFNENVGSDARALSPAEETTLSVMADKDAAALLNKWNKGAALETLGYPRIASSSAIGLITVPSASPQQFMSAGRALERVWLQASKNNLDFQPICLSLAFLKYTGDKKNSNLLPDRYLDELNGMRKQFVKLFDDFEGREAAFLFRLFYSVKPNKISLKKPGNEIYFIC